MKPFETTWLYLFLHNFIQPTIGLTGIGKLINGRDNAILKKCLYIGICKYVY